MTTPTVIHIRRRFAVLLEDCIETVLPANIDPGDQNAVNTWSQENYDTLADNAVVARYDAEFDNGAKFLWEDRFFADIDGMYDELVVEIPEDGYQEAIK